MRKINILIIITIFSTLNVQSQMQTSFHISKLKSINSPTGQVEKFYTLLETCNDSIEMIFEIDLKKTKNNCLVSADLNNMTINQYFNLQTKSEKSDSIKKYIDLIFDHSTKKISLEIVYFPMLNEIRYVWLKNKKVQDRASIFTFENKLMKNNPFPNLTFCLLDGKKISSKELEGKCLVINSYFTTCPPCLKEIPGLNKLVKKYKGNKNIIFIAIASVNKNILVEFMQTNEFNYIQALSNNEIDKILGNIFPKNIIINEKGIITYYNEGGSENEYMEIDKGIQELLTNKITY